MKRLLRLIRAGYQVDLPSSLERDGVVSLRHPARWDRVAEPYVLIDEDGRLIGSIPDTDEDQLRIGPTDSEAFALFASRVPKPTWWDLNGATVMLPIVWAFFLSIGWGFSVLVSWIWRVAFGND